MIVRRYDALSGRALRIFKKRESDVQWSWSHSIHWRLLRLDVHNPAINMMSILMVIGMGDKSTLWWGRHSIETFPDLDSFAFSYNHKWDWSSNARLIETADGDHLWEHTAEHIQSTAFENPEQVINRHVTWPLRTSAPSSGSKTETLECDRPNWSPYHPLCVCRQLPCRTLEAHHTITHKRDLLHL